MFESARRSAPTTSVEDLERLVSDKPPGLLWHLGWMLLCAVVVVCLVLVFAPWRQNTAGSGQVTAIEPEKRQHDIHTLVAGRISEWYVRDGDTVQAGDPILRIVDNDPRLLDRLEEELIALRAQLAAAEAARDTAEIDLDRRQRLHVQGLASRRDLENARIVLEERRAEASSVTAQIARKTAAQAQQTQQTVVAPSAGRIVRTRASGTSSYIQRGAVVASFLPDNEQLVVELFINGRDAPLVVPGRKARLEFEGWPAVQFSGWPEVAIGTFGGEVVAVEATALPDGSFRVFVGPDPDDAPWPAEPFLRFGGQVRGWILMDEVSLGYELWRLLNQFPLNPIIEPTTQSVATNP